MYNGSCPRLGKSQVMRRRKPRTRVIVEPLPTLPTSGAVIGYARVSTAEQSLEMQISALRKYGCNRILDEKVSAASSKRPMLTQALSILREGDVLVVWKMDRLARSLTDLLRRVAYINECGAQFVSLTEKIDTSSASGRLLFHVLGALGEFERDLIKERTTAGMKAAKERGVKFGASPMFGDNTIKAMQADRSAGKSLRWLAAHYGCSVGTVQNWTVGPSRPKKRK